MLPFLGNDDSDTTLKRGNTDSDSDFKSFFSCNMILTKIKSQRKISENSLKTINKISGFRKVVFVFSSVLIYKDPLK